ncbi:hypothetical protein DEA8626_00227 [Defluviimonas aquaemixtae]|uniref:N-acetyltransferase domain-containing protein n=1 Tax=Albidovulum aquaemixtae TaxID=1542388 RepID=A0A2R8B249_9RHOB|nr:GNAT family N-acetyltransferase [Defluviimonas aquaemixtae]SPH16716.1 hypothetical protein DEA8626_00227 [Defluviimonas aquaemixtae]
MTDLFAVGEATWPAAAQHAAGAFVVREGRGGGQRVSCATAEGSWSETDIDAAEAVHQALGQPPLFMIRADEDDLDAALAERGYRIKDPVHIYSGPSASLAEPPPKPISAFALWPPLAMMRDLWAEGGIGPARLAVMERAEAPKTAILGRVRDRASGVAYVAIHTETAMMHALYVIPDQRRQGSALNIVRKSAGWAQHHGAERFSVLVTQANQSANALYSSLGMQIVGHYHYRSRQP